MKVIKNVRIYDFDQYIKNGYIVFDDVIHEVGLMSAYKESNLETIDGENKLLMPNLVNAHSHIYSQLSRGLNVPYNPQTFKEILEQLWWKLDRNLDNEMTYYSGIVSAHEYLRHGVTSIIDHHASGEIIGSLDSLNKALCKYNIKHILCFETSDRFNVDDCIKENLSNIKKRVGHFGLHAAFTLCDETLEKVSKVLNGAPIHIHVAESKYDQTYSLGYYDKPVIERLNDFNLITKHSIITHGLYLSENELDIIKKNEAVIAINVSSNMNNAVGLPNYQKMKDKGIKVIIGNDGINQQMAKEYINLFFSQHHFDETPTKFTFDDVVDIINNTYLYTSELLNKKLGKIKKGYCADIQLLEYNEPTPINKDNIMGHLLFGLFNDFVPTEVYIDGKLMVKDRKVLVDDKDYKNAKYSAKKLWTKIEKEGRL